MYDRSYRSRSLLFLALAGASSAAMAAGAESAGPASALFVNEATLDGMIEVAFARVALTKSQDAGMRSFAQRMVADHGESNSELASIAKSKGIDAPTSLDARHRALLRRLQRKSGGEFDRAYASHVNMGHAGAIALFEAATNSSDVDFAGFATKRLPMLMAHEQLARKLTGR